MESILLYILFIILLLLVVNSYLIYPAVILLLSKIIRSKAKTDTSQTYPSISILISAYNEEKVIGERINNISSLEYDFNNIELIIGSDNSSDRTNDILLEASEKYPWLKVHIFKNRNGKAGVLNKLIEEASNELILFSDANTVFEIDAIKNLVAEFADTDTGGVSGKLVLKKSGSETNETNEETVYWKFETFIKKAEGHLGILIGANGGIFAIRKELFREIPIVKAVTDDLFLSLSVLADGYKFKYCNDAVAFEDVGKTVKEEFKRKSRFAATNFQTLAFFKSLLFSKNLLLSYSFWSHKVIRWFVPVIMIMFLLVNGFLYNSSVLVNYFFYLQIIFYLLAIIGFLFYKLNMHIRIFSYPFFFVMSNAALFRGLIRFFRRKHSVIWEATSR